MNELKVRSHFGAFALEGSLVYFESFTDSWIEESWVSDATKTASRYSSYGCHQRMAPRCLMIFELPLHASEQREIPPCQERGCWFCKNRHVWQMLEPTLDGTVKRHKEEICILHPAGKLPQTVPFTMAKGMLLRAEPGKKQEHQDSRQGTRSSCLPQHTHTYTHPTSRVTKAI